MSAGRSFPEVPLVRSPALKRVSPSAVSWRWGRQASAGSARGLRTAWAGWRETFMPRSEGAWGQ